MARGGRSVGGVRSLLLLTLTSSTLALAACAGPTGSSTGLKEVYIEPYQSDTAPLSRWPLSVDDEERCYGSLRSLATGRLDAQRKLAILVDQWDAQRPPGGVAAIPSQIHIDATVFSNGVPDTLFYPTQDEQRKDSAVYVGHSVFRGDAWSSRGPLTHHLRFLIVNCERAPLRLDAKRVALALSANEEEAVQLSDLTFLAAANERGEAVRGLIVAPGDSGLLHVFFQAGAAGRSLQLSWELQEARFAAVGEGLGLSQEEEGAAPAEPRGALSDERETPLAEAPQWPPPASPLPAGAAAWGGDAPLRSWRFRAILARRYVLEKGKITLLEQRVANEEPLPEPVSAEYTEPRVTPLAPR